MGRKRDFEEHESPEHLHRLLDEHDARAGASHRGVRDAAAVGIWVKHSDGDYFVCAYRSGMACVHWSPPLEDRQAARQLAEWLGMVLRALGHEVTDQPAPPMWFPGPESWSGALDGRWEHEPDEGELDDENDDEL